MFRIVFYIAALASAGAVVAQPSGASGSPWLTSIEGGAIHQFDADLDDGGSYSASRASIEAGIAYATGPRNSFGISLGYSRDDYRFDGSNGLAGADPWGTVNEYRISTPIRFGVGERVNVFALPSIRWSAESGGDWSEAMNAGLIAGANYRVSDRLTIGPGFGVFDEIEDGVNAFPILLIDWQITDTLALETGGGLGATRGPGLQLTSSAVSDWTLGLGARYETYRFRLDEDGAFANGVGEEKGVLTYFSATYRPSPAISLSALAGMEVGGKLRLENALGERIASDDADAAPFIGFAFQARL
ncbi:MAG: hypothetical protein V2J20_03055 [Wenzhouxiangella sp.]|jgi:hypothetical protein|nr:hypothetical protein [Wenzhouxiangella sp.]